MFYCAENKLNTLQTFQLSEDQNFFFEKLKFHVSFSRNFDASRESIGKGNMIYT